MSADKRQRAKSRAATAEDVTAVGEEFVMGDGIHGTDMTYKRSNDVFWTKKHVFLVAISQHEAEAGADGAQQQQTERW
jgi:hypothetical protein